MKLVPKLNLNKHPKDNENLSLVNALNIKLSADGSCLTNEESIKTNDTINKFIKEFFVKLNKTFNKIITIIPCNTELVLFANATDSLKKLYIFRYNESNTQNENIYACKGVNDEYAYLEYNNGKIKSTFTYNVDNELILAIAEYDADIDIPLRVINLGEYGKNSKDNLFGDKIASINPEVILPNIHYMNFVKGTAYKGWCYLFIRMKINNGDDYTQWYSIGHPIYIDELVKQSIIKYIYKRNIKNIQDEAPLSVITANNKSGYGVGVTDNFSNNSEISNQTFNVKFTFANDLYKYYQIGVICATKSYTKAFKTSTLKLDDDYFGSFTFNPKLMEEANVDDFIINNYNPFNVKNIVNYKNRLYISNYKENTNNKNIDKSIIDSVKLSLDKNYYTERSIVYNVSIIKKDVKASNQYTSDYSNMILFKDYLGVDENYTVDLTYIDNNGEEITYTNKIKNLVIRSTNGEVYGFAAIHYNENGVFYPIGIKASYSYPNNIVKIKIKELDVVLEFDNENTVLVGGTPHIDTKLGFDDRRKNSTLIPGEVYNFFIHFVDKYGHATNGYRINNNIKWIVQNEDKEIIPYYIKYDNKDYYVAIPLNDDMLVFDDYEEVLKLNLGPIDVYKTIDTKNKTLSDKEEDYNIIRAVKSYLKFDSFINENYIDFKWFQVIESFDKNNFNVFINNQDERLFKVPLEETFIGTLDQTGNRVMQHTIYTMSVNNVTIPDGYVGYFISYEKHEPIQRYTGILTRNDFLQQNSITYNFTTTKIKNNNNSKSDTMLFYSSQFDIADSIKIDYNVLRITGKNSFYTEDIPIWDFYQRGDSIKYFYDMNKPLWNSINKNIINYAMPQNTIAPANSAINGRAGLGTALQIKDSYSLFKDDDSDTLSPIYYASLLNVSRDLYTKKDKELIRLSDIFYNTSYQSIRDGFNGHWSYDGVLIYEGSGIMFNDVDKTISRLTDNTEYYKEDLPNINYHSFQNDIPFLAYAQYIVCSDIFYESKRFKNKPDTITYISYIDSENEKNNVFSIGHMVTPANSIDLFENVQTSSDNLIVKKYTNYADWKSSNEEFNKTIRRSNVIQDESIVNSWRTFPVEGYKNITENKGKITNLIGVGYIFLVHTEHSLFMFDTNNMINAINTNLQITQPDAFEVDYKEVFTSLLGYGGLQDDKSWILDNFGYIYYNNDFNRFYKFDNGKLDVIDADIVQWLNKYKPYNIRFANDKINNRLLIKMNYNINNEVKNIVLSYNYNTNTFISLHSYYFDEAYNTKTQLYLKCNDIHHDCSLHYFIQDGSSYGKFDNVIKNIGEAVTKPSKISIIVNPSYLDIKWLEHITYKLTKSINASEIDYTISPVEGEKQPFSGNLIKVYNNLVNTGELDITVDNENSKNIFNDYTKPYWDLGNWNFNYLHNNIANHITQPFSDDFSRLYGNYFIIEFTFNNEDELKVEFEELDCKLIK